jgi:hypothetical protein
LKIQPKSWPAGRWDRWWCQESARPHRPFSYARHSSLVCWARGYIVLKRIWQTNDFEKPNQHAIPCVISDSEFSTTTNWARSWPPRWRRMKMVPSSDVTVTSSSTHIYTLLSH